jgi:hypothetical protein
VAQGWTYQDTSCEWKTKEGNGKLRRNDGKGMRENNRTEREITLKRTIELIRKWVQERGFKTWVQKWGTEHKVQNMGSESQG